MNGWSVDVEGLGVNRNGGGGEGEDKGSEGDSEDAMCSGINGDGEMGDS